MNRRDALKTLGLTGIGLYISQMGYGSIQDFLSDDLNRSMFGKDFKWGVATAAYQIEGAYQTDGKGESVWDRFTANKKHIKNSENGNISCDFYNRYNTDLKILKDLNMQCFRFSTSWTRILPNGVGTVNQKGIDFYHRLIDSCLELGLDPWLTLFHWDTPQALEDKGGWTNRDMVSWFNEYTDVVTKAYGDKVKNWMILNEPISFVGGGYLIGVHAPGRKGISNALPAAHHATLCQAEAARVVRQNVPNAYIGTTFSVSHIDPKNAKEKHVKAATRLDAITNRLFSEPTFGMGYPFDALPFFKRIQKYMKDGDEQRMKFDFDFIGLQNYFRLVGRHSLYPPVMWANQVPFKDLSKDLTEMGWETYPEGLYKVLKRFSKYPIKDIYVTENGVAYPDVVDNGRVHDTKRIQFFKDYLQNVLKAKNEGVNVKGYFVWTFLDNFEWAEGYHPRFGIVYCDFKTQERIIKDSGYWFQQFLKD